MLNAYLSKLETPPLKGVAFGSVFAPTNPAEDAQLFNLKENPHEFIAEHHNTEVTALIGITPEAKQTNLAKDPQPPPNSTKCAPSC
jgi:hypothetical protein